MIRAMADVQKNSKVVFIVIMMIAIIIVGCSSNNTSTKKSGDYTVTMKTGYDVPAVWKAGIESLPEIRFSATSTNSTTGLISAEQITGKGKGPAARLNIRVSRTSGSTMVVISYTAPDGTAGDHAAADQFITALKKRITDLEPAVKN